MALITRLSRLFQADFHAVLDRIEEPDIQLKQAIREMQIDLQQSEQRLALMQHESETLSNLVTDANARLSAFDEELPTLRFEGNTRAPIEPEIIEEPPADYFLHKLYRD